MPPDRLQDKLTVIDWSCVVTNHNIASSPTIEFYKIYIYCIWENTLAFELEVLILNRRESKEKDLELGFNGCFFFALLFFDCLTCCQLEKWNMQSKTWTWSFFTKDLHKLFQTFFRGQSDKPSAEVTWKHALGLIVHGDDKDTWHLTSSSAISFCLRRKDTPFRIIYG